MEVKDLATFKTMVGHQLPPTDWLTVTQEMVNDFAKATLDFQWIHVDPERAAKESPFGTAIAHGFMSVSLIPKFLEDAITMSSVKMGVNYGMEKVRLPHHVPVGSKMRAQITIANVEDYGDSGVKTTWDVVLELEGIEKPACVAKFISLAFE